MCDARQHTKDTHGLGGDRGWRGLPARRRPPILLGVLGCVALPAWLLAAEETATAEPEAGLKARGQAFWEARIEGVTIDEAKAILTVRTRIRVKHPLLERRSQELVVREEWVKRQGEWYRVHPQS
jgi:hypothetical protein